MLINPSEISIQARDIILAKDREFNINDIVDDIQRVYPYSKKNNQQIIQACCLQLANLVGEGLIESVDMPNGIYKPT